MASATGIDPEQGPADMLGLLLAFTVPYSLKYQSLPAA
jgi:hypothetical protein